MSASGYDAATGAGSSSTVSPEVAYFESVLTDMGVNQQYWGTDIKEFEQWAAKESNVSAWPMGGANQGGEYNPLNVANLNAPGATKYNSVGVENFPSAQEGAYATAQRLENGLYNNIVSDLYSGTPFASDPSTAKEFSTWSGGGYTNDIFGGSGNVAVASATGGSGGSGGNGPLSGLFNTTVFGGLIRGLFYLMFIVTGLALIVTGIIVVVHRPAARLATAAALRA